MTTSAGQLGKAMTAFVTFLPIDARPAFAGAGLGVAGSRQRAVVVAVARLTSAGLDVMVGFAAALSGVHRARLVEAL